MILAGEIFMLAGTVFVLLAGIGALRFRDVYSRMHTAAKAPTLGLLLIAIGLGLIEQSVSVTVTLTLVVLLYLFTGPVGVHVLGRAVHGANPPDVDVRDDLLEANQSVEPGEELRQRD
jgi:multicomponent Na+:H+ antiporter subunit G